MSSPTLPPTAMVDLSPTDHAKRARPAARHVAVLSTATKNAVLTSLADLIAQNSPELLNANAQDIAIAERAGLPAPKLKRLALTAASIAQLADGVRQIAELPDPVGQTTLDRTVPSGLRIQRVRAPLGVIAMIYEARPGVTIDAFALCLKSGNACILRGGKEAERSNAALTHLAHQALIAHNVTPDALINLSGTDRSVLAELLTLTSHIDLVIPRGGRDLIEMVCTTSRIPTIQHYQGICHIFVDESADLDLAVNICATAKTSAPATCNAAECILVHKNIAQTFIPRMLARYASDGVEVRGTPLVLALAPEGATNVVPAAPTDFGNEFLDLIIAMRTVDTLDEAVDHIAAYSSNHTEAILTSDHSPGGSADQFTSRVQSSCVLVNASTRFNDGFQLGLGAEIGISTSKLHAYGPMGLEELTTQRWIAKGEGQTR
ncbi:MAG: glutamate-5-semialdehyde dehydrogenase [Phycisphaerales bacterium]|nr:glutamate-5-semialdehyde dehydrogenase [Phycisphaerales bacterium]